MTQTTFNELSLIQKKLLIEAEEAMDKAYCPYSGFSVGAALLTKDEQIISGSNVENGILWIVGMCRKNCNSQSKRFR